ncbi:MAG: hypothetical protein ACFB10_24995 [Salibacteraceae bacterium]
MMWLFGRNIDLSLLFAPVWCIWLLLFFLPESTLELDIPLWLWVVCILMIDVAHVWSTIFRTYFDAGERQHHKQLLGVAPIASFVLLFVIASESVDWFWRCLAYLALFHFIKQQYGFFALYSAATGARKVRRWLPDKWVVYGSMLFPVLYWHGHSRNFSWFVNGDFFQFETVGSSLWQWGIGLYWLVLLFWAVEETYRVRKGEMSFSIGRGLWLITTALNRYLGIVYFNSDMAFTLTNVVAHGVPYLVLIIGYQNSKAPRRNWWQGSKAWKLSAVVVGGSLLFAFSEEYFWDLLWNQERAALFGEWLAYPQIENPQTQALILALLSLPQVVHYVLDGFIWKVNDKNPDLKKWLRSHG